MTAPDDGAHGLRRDESAGDDAGATQDVDRAYESAYVDFPLDEPDAWGDLASWHRALDELGRW